MALTVGDTAPPFTALDLNGGTIALDSYLDKPVVVAFEGLTWCKPCQFEAPILQEIWQSYKSHIHMVVITRDDNDTAKLKAAVNQFGLTMPIVQDDNTIGKEWIGKKVSPTATSYSVPTVLFLKPSPPAIGQQGDPPVRHVVCNLKNGIETPESVLKADLIARIEGCLPPWEHPDPPGYWEEFDPLPWLDPGPLKTLLPEKRDILLSVAISELARNLSNVKFARQLERIATDASEASVRALQVATNRKKSDLAIDDTVSTTIDEDSERSL